MKFSSFNDAYMSTLEMTYTEPQFCNAPRGAKSLERLSVSFEVEDPVQRVCSLEERKQNIVFNFAEALWYLDGNDSLDFISYYAPSIRKYSHDGQCLTGTAYGPKIRSLGSPPIDQLSRVIGLLRDEDPDSKRAVIQIFSASEDLSLRNIDVSCTIALQFLVRAGRLYALAFMRANDAYRGCLSDVFSFTFLQEVIAREVGVAVGSYFHHVGSMHVYEPDQPAIRRILDAKATVVADMDKFPQMPGTTPLQCVARVLEWEKALRTRSVTPREVQNAKNDMPAYWWNIVRLFAVYRCIVDGDRPPVDLLNEMPSCFINMCRWKWPAHFLPDVESLNVDLASRQAVTTLSAT